MPARKIASAKPEPRKDRCQRLIAVRQKPPGRSQREFSKALDMKMRTYQTYESGERGISIELLVKLNRIEHVEPMWLLEEQGPQYTLVADPAQLALRVSDDIDQAAGAAGLHPLDLRLRQMWLRRFTRKAFETGASPTLEIEAMVSDYAGGSRTSNHRTIRSLAIAGITSTEKVA